MKKIITALLFIALFTGCKKSIQPTACFTFSQYSYSTSLDSVIFENCSKDATSYLWDFGDGTTSTKDSPIHLYEKSEFDEMYIVSLTAYNGSNYDVLTDTVTLDLTGAWKPNIYIYPERTIDLCVSLNFPKGGKVITSIPDYENDWCVNVEPSGKIDGTYDFLFYESMQPNIWQMDKGWVVNKENLNNFFSNNMKTYGFSINEITDFTDYWIPRLTDSDFYAIYPQTNIIINKVIELEFSVSPQNVNRLFYVIKGVNKESVLQEPVIIPFNKQGFYVNEWGVVL